MSMGFACWRPNHTQEPTCRRATPSVFGSPYAIKRTTRPLLVLQRGAPPSPGEVPRQARRRITLERRHFPSGELLGSHGYSGGKLIGFCAGVMPTDAIVSSARSRPEQLGT